MSSNRPYTFDDVSNALAGGADKYEPRPHTTVYMEDSEQSAVVYLYGSRIASMFSDGTVKLEASPDMSNTTRNRLNDILAPMRWKLRKINGKWYLEAKGHFMEYITGMIVAPVNNNGKRK